MFVDAWLVRRGLGRETGVVRVESVVGVGNESVVPHGLVDAVETDRGDAHHRLTRPHRADL